MAEKKKRAFARVARAPATIYEVARKFRAKYDEARADLGDDLGGFSLFDLLLDSFPDYPLRTIEDGIVIAGLAQVREETRKG